MRSKFKSHPIRIVCFALFFIGYTQIILSQAVWAEQNLGKSFYSGISMASTDVNGDLIDDLLILDHSKKLWLGINDGLAHFFWRELPFHSLTAVYSVNVADIDRNGYSDIVLSGESTQLHVLYQSHSGFSNQIVDGDYFFSQAACLFDINLDGWIDFTICDDNAASRIYLNDQTGQLNRTLILIDLEIPGIGNSAGNYGCIWTDFDWDGHPDLYISKCKPGVNDPRDPRRLNLFYVFDTISNFWTSQGVERGLDIGDQSWASLFEDFDNDGLIDVFVINHYTPCNILKQNLNHRFENVTGSSGLAYSGIAIQTNASDFDNDGDLDILISGTSTELWQNQGGMKFIKMAVDAFQHPFSSFAVGDFNADGMLDIYTSYADLLNAPSNTSDKLWLNLYKNNPYLKLSLEGTLSNRNGIGTRIKIVANGTMQIRELHAGESYGIQNSLNVHFGLGQAVIIDSVFVYWPSGMLSVYYNLPINSHLLIHESGCLQNLKRDQIPLKLFFCEKVDTSLIVDPSLQVINWNTGSTSSEIKINQEGVYFYSAIDSNNCFVISEPIVIYLNPKNPIHLNHQYQIILCEGDQLELSLTNKESVLWSNSQTSNSINITEKGIYYAVKQGYCELEYSDSLKVDVFQLPEAPQVIPDTAYKSGPRQLDGNKSNCFWYLGQQDQTAMDTGRYFITDSLLQSTVYWIESYNRHLYQELHGGLFFPSYSSGPYHAAFINNQMLFNVYKDLILDSVTLYTDDPGERIIDLLDGNGILIKQKLVELSKGKNQVYLGFEILAHPKSYKLTTNSEKNLAVFGSLSPRLYRTDQHFYYPFYIEDKLRITSSDKGDSYYYYFYDWIIRQQDVVCVSERIEFPVILIPNETVQGNFQSLNIYFNGKQELIIKGLSSNQEVLLINPDGRIINQLKSRYSQELISIPNLEAGLYFIKIQDKKLLKSYCTKVFIPN